VNTLLITRAMRTSIFERLASQETKASKSLKFSSNEDNLKPSTPDTAALSTTSASNLAIFDRLSSAETFVSRNRKGFGDHKQEKVREKRIQNHQRYDNSRVEIPIHLKRKKKSAKVLNTNVFDRLANSGTVSSMRKNRKSDTYDSRFEMLRKNVTMRDFNGSTHVSTTIRNKSNSSFKYK